MDLYKEWPWDDLLSRATQKRRASSDVLLGRTVVWVGPPLEEEVTTASITSLAGIV